MSDASMKATLAEKISAARQTIAQIQALPQSAANAWLLDQEQTQLEMYERTLVAMG
jgi:hypothetical protein